MDKNRIGSSDQSGIRSGSPALWVLPIAFPMMMAVGCMMAALPAAGISLPFFVAVISLLLVGIPMTEAITVFIAALTAYFSTHARSLVAQRPPQT